MEGGIEYRPAGNGPDTDSGENEGDSQEFHGGLSLFLKANKSQSHKGAQTLREY
jgi:hypothetical protein